MQRACKSEMHHKSVNVKPITTERSSSRHFGSKAPALDATACSFWGWKTVGSKSLPTLDAHRSDEASEELGKW